MCQTLFCCCLPSPTGLSKLTLGDAMVVVTGVLAGIGSMVGTASVCLSSDTCTVSESTLGLSGLGGSFAGIVIGYAARIAVEKIVENCCQSDSEMEALVDPEDPTTNYTIQ